MAGIGVIIEADIDRVGAVVDSSFERWQISCGANEFHAYTQVE